MFQSLSGKIWLKFKSLQILIVYGGMSHLYYWVKCPHGWWLFHAKNLDGSNVPEFNCENLTQILKVYRYALFTREEPINSWVKCPNGCGYVLSRTWACCFCFMSLHPRIGQMAFDSSVKPIEFWSEPSCGSQSPLFQNLDKCSHQSHK